MALTFFGLGHSIARVKAQLAAPLGFLLTVLHLTSLAAPLALHPDNPHYFLWRDRPAVLITSGEHYGAVMNLDFDYTRYLKELKRNDLNLTRVFVGSYVEPLGAFKIARNSLAPASGKFICPWKRSDQPGYANGGNKFDLTQWDPAYFKRLKDFMKQADKAGVIVEMNLFCPFYDESQWKLSPQNTLNNVNGVGAVACTNVYTLDRHGGLLAIHEGMVRKLVAELNSFDNLYYEICNEPYFGGVTLEWQHHIADVITQAESQLKKRHLISQNIANGAKKIDKPHPAISIFNFHYASPPTAVAQNYHLNKVIGDNETGFKGTNDTHYRMEAWQFLLAGGALYNNLDYSFVAGNEAGDFVYPQDQPGGGNAIFRKQMRLLSGFIRGFDFVRMKPDQNSISAVHPKETQVHTLAKPGADYAAYFFSKLSLTASAALEAHLKIPPGKYRVEWVDVLSGTVARSETIQVKESPVTAAFPEYKGEAALRVIRLS